MRAEKELRAKAVWRWPAGGICKPETVCKIGLPGNKERTDDATRRRDGVGMGIEVNAK